MNVLAMAWFRPPGKVPGDTLEGADSERATRRPGMNFAADQTAIRISDSQVGVRYTLLLSLGYRIPRQFRELQPQLMA